MRPVKISCKQKKEFVAKAKRAKRISIVVVADTLINVYDKEKGCIYEYMPSQADKLGEVLEEITSKEFSGGCSKI